MIHVFYQLYFILKLTLKFDESCKITLIIKLLLYNLFVNKIFLIYKCILIRVKIWNLIGI